VLKSGGRWIDAPRLYGPHKALYNRFVRFVRRAAKGVWFDPRHERQDHVFPEAEPGASRRRVAYAHRESRANKTGDASLCGPAALLFNYASDRPGHYARFALDLYEKGKAEFGRLMIKPGKDVRDYTPPWSVAHVDWLTMASLRDSENWFLDYDTADKEFAGINGPSTVERPALPVDG
jgi:hypothetical protein